MEQYQRILLCVPLISIMENKQKQIEIQYILSSKNVIQTLDKMLLSSTISYINDGGHSPMHLENLI